MRRTPPDPPAARVPAAEPRPTLLHSLEMGATPSLSAASVSNSAADNKDPPARGKAQPLRLHQLLISPSGT